LAAEFLKRDDGILFREPVKERHPALGKALTADTVREVMASLMRLDNKGARASPEAIEQKMQALIREVEVGAAVDALVSLLGLEVSQQNGRSDKKQRIKARVRARRKRIAERRKQKKAAKAEQSEGAA
jgi:hypothetical protein